MNAKIVSMLTICARKAGNSAPEAYPVGPLDVADASAGRRNADARAVSTASAANAWHKGAVGFRIAAATGLDVASA
jgi:hypothetical protein